MVGFALLLPTAALADFGEFSGPGAVDPDDSPRVDTPNDPKFDQCEPDDEEPGGSACTIYGEEQYGLFSFSPESANQFPLFPHNIGATTYPDCSQLDAQGKDANQESSDPECAQISGVRADVAWKYSIGRPDIKIAILDTGIEWQNTELVNKIALNEDELPLPKVALGTDCADYDCNGDGAFNVRDYLKDPRITDLEGSQPFAEGDQEADHMLDASDLIAQFSNTSDSDSNGYVDDIAGWDFFDNDNDPFDASSCCNAEGHGTDRAESAAAETNNDAAGAGLCPECQIMPLRVWDTFVVPGDNFAMGMTYAAENGASVVEGAVGGLSNTQFSRRAAEFADSQGVALTLVSSDINSANHNYPTNYNEGIYVGGSIYDTAPIETCDGPGGLGPLSPPNGFPPMQFTQGCNQFIGLLRGNGVFVSPAQPPTTSFFRNSNLTQYGGKADIVLMGSTGSENTGQAAGAAGLLASFGRQRFGPAGGLSGNEIRQLLTMSAEDVRPLNTGAIGQPDKANAGWDPHFGYGRVNLAAAMARIANDPHAATPASEWPCQFTGANSDPNCVPPEAQIDAPDWFSPVNVDRLPADGMAIKGFARAPHSNSGVGAWELEYACGADALDSAFVKVPKVGGGFIEGTGAVDGLLGRVPKAFLEGLTAEGPPDPCPGAVLNDAGRPAGTAAEPFPANTYPEPDPERHSVQIRLTVHEADDPANFGRYRKTIFPYQDDGNLPAWPKAVGEGSSQADLITGSGGEVPPRLYDLNGDNELDVVLGTSSGELHVLDSAGQPLPSFNGGAPVRTDPLAIADAARIPAGLSAPRESLRAPAIGDIDGDRAPEIVASAGEHVYAWHTDGSVVTGFPVRIDPALSEPCLGVPKPCFDSAQRKITSSNHLKRGFVASPALADLVPEGAGQNRKLEIAIGALDQHLYAWDGDGDLLPAPGEVGPGTDQSYPVKLASAGAAGAEIIASPAVADLDGDGKRTDVIVATNEVIEGDTPDGIPPLFDLINAALESSTGSNPVYAIKANGAPVTGWPVKIGVAAGDLLPFVLPGHDAAVLNGDVDAADEVSLSAGTSLASAQGTKLVNGNGSTAVTYENGVTNGADNGPILNLADYPAVGNVTGSPTGPQVFKGGLTLNGAANLLAVNQNLPFNHVVQGWDPRTGQVVPGYPRATDDFQLVSQPAIGRVFGPGPTRQVIYGTGMYQLHAYGVGGAETTALGWPKFTGGWTQATPSIGDVDGNDKLDVVTITREGWTFVWETTSDACEDAAGTTNDEWWTFHHDEFGSANYATDARPPGSVTDLAVDTSGGGAELSWKAPGDDWLCGDADVYEVRKANGPIEEPSDGQLVVTDEPAAGTGETETDSLSAAEIDGATHLAVFYRDDAGNWGRPKSIALAGDPDPDPDPGGGGGGGTGGGSTGGGSGGGDTDGGQAGDQRRCSTLVAGTNQRDTLRGDARSELFEGGGGRDKIKAGGGDDCVHAGGGSDDVRGQGGKDRIGGDNGRDKLRGNGGDDRITGGDDRDKIKGGGGDDLIRAGGDKDRDRINCGKGKDTVIADKRDKLKNCEKVKERE
ncbi:MAG: S8 family serine peptidase [Solirubrobacterales bacterium]